MLTRPQIRAQARRSLAGNWKPAVLHFLLFIVISSLINTVTQNIQYIGWWIGILLEAPLGYGIYNHYLDFARGQVPDANGLFRGFRRYKETFILYILSMIFTVLWTLLFIIPGIIAALRYSQAQYLLRDNPNMSPLEAISQSKQMMIGHKWRLFVLYLSFIGWALLCILTLGIGFLWLGPYYYTTIAHFYEELRTQGTTNNNNNDNGYLR
ncbi:putative membrane protein [Paenibacillus taihuensis]|uniref:Putative membrane protein n=1 Tax=Paenibacillus taihuensis TaxID=1156355 RepID=A0A3D9S5U0_9BACL|nr:DUF975 family protein [Paenibacillus taihuensis]REE83932.1 putative membrane protein [Paenibacillus taihuensis]